MIGIGVLISGGGSNLQAIMDACKSGILKGKAMVSVVISNRQDAFGLERARKSGIPAVSLNKKEFESPEAFCGEIKKLLIKSKAAIFIASIPNLAPRVPAPISEATSINLIFFIPFCFRKSIRFNNE